MSDKMINKLSDKSLHFFHVLSNIRPTVWIALYVAVTPVYALIYWLLPEGQFRIPDENPMDYGSCLYYSIVTITTLGFGDYTPTHAWSQAVTACEVMTGLIVLGLFLNAVGSMKSEIDVTSALEKQRILHFNQERDKLLKNTPVIIHHINNFLTCCYLATTPLDKRNSTDPVYNPDFTIDDMADIDKPSTLRDAPTDQPVISQLLNSATRTSLFLDSVQNRVDISLWPELLENFFTFVANEQIFEAKNKIAGGKVDLTTDDLSELSAFIKKNASAAMQIEAALTRLALNQA
ncbi:MAG: two pore domain potassium channel family protein [Paramuribaculum sp.]|nr:two pore domain potassium channel family protein [Paramuribaculum sp.]